MKFAYSTNVFKLRPLSEAIDGIGKFGFEGVEIIADRPHAFPADLSAAQVTALNQNLEQRKMRVCNLNSAVVTALPEANDPSWLEEDWQLREMRIRYTLDCFRLAAAMGVPHVSTVAGGRIPQTMTQLDAWRLFVANMHRVLPMAIKLGVCLLIQAEPGYLLETSAHVLDLLKELDFPEYLKVNFDAGHYFCVGEDPCEAWEKLKAHVVHVHLEDIPATRAHRHLQLGEGAMDIPGFLHHLQAGQYEGFVTVRVAAHEQRAEDAVQASAHYLQKHGFLPNQAEAGG